MQVRFSSTSIGMSTPLVTTTHTISSVPHHPTSSTVDLLPRPYLDCMAPLSPHSLTHTCTAHTCTAHTCLIPCTPTCSILVSLSYYYTVATSSTPVTFHCTPVIRSSMSFYCLLIYTPLFLIWPEACLLSRYISFSVRRKSGYSLFIPSTSNRAIISSLFETLCSLSPSCLKKRKVH